MSIHVSPVPAPFMDSPHHPGSPSSTNLLLPTRPCSAPPVLQLSSTVLAVALQALTLSSNPSSPVKTQFSKDFSKFIQKNSPLRRSKRAQSCSLPSSLPYGSGKTLGSPLNSLYKSRNEQHEFISGKTTSPNVSDSYRQVSTTEPENDVSSSFQPIPTLADVWLQLRGLQIPDPETQNYLKIESAVDQPSWTPNQTLNDLIPFENHFLNTPRTLSLEKDLKGSIDEPQSSIFDLDLEIESNPVLYQPPTKDCPEKPKLEPLRAEETLIASTAPSFDILDPETLVPIVPSEKRAKKVIFPSHLGKVRYFKRNDRPSDVSSVRWEMADEPASYLANYSFLLPNWPGIPSPPGSHWLNLNTDSAGPIHDLSEKSSPSGNNLTYFPTPYSSLRFPTPHESVMIEQVRLKVDMQCESFPRLHAIPTEDHLAPTQDRLILQGTILVRNFSYEKTVQVRYTTNFWKTYQDLHCTYRDPVNTEWDRFEFQLPLTQGHGPGHFTIYFCVQYTYSIYTPVFIQPMSWNTPLDSQTDSVPEPGPQKHSVWDNNYGSNYEVVIKRHALPSNLLDPSFRPA